MLIRPLVFCGERQVAAAASRCQLPVVKSSCPADGSTSRQRTKELIARLEKDYPDLKSKVMGAVERAASPIGTPSDGLPRAFLFFRRGLPGAPRLFPLPRCRREQKPIRV